MKLMNQLRMMPGLACLLFVFAAVSCQTTTPPAADVTKTLKRSHWVKVSSQPPTFYPKGVVADSPTDHRTGEWVYTDDEIGSRYFIPHRGLGKTPRQTLVHEAQAARSDRKVAQIDAEDEEILSRNIRNAVIYGPDLWAFISSRDGKYYPE